MFRRVNGINPNHLDWHPDCSLRDYAASSNPCAFSCNLCLAEVVDRHGANFVLHGHAHNGKSAGVTTAGLPVHNVAITLLQSQQPPAVYRLFDV
jgi:hypothetical protein